MSCLRNGALILVGVVVFGALANQSRHSPPDPQESSQADDATVSDNEPKPTPEQLKSAEYLDKQYGIKANATCGAEADDYLRSIAKYDFDWDDEAKGFLGVKFDKHLRSVGKPGVLILTSSYAKLQNGFGAWQHIQLFCEFDTQQDKVLSFENLPMQ